jgi:hypothetical protein
MQPILVTVHQMGWNARHVDASLETTAGRGAYGIQRQITHRVAAEV